MSFSGEAHALCRVCAIPFQSSTMFRMFDERNDPLPTAEAFWRVSEIEILVEESRFPQSCCTACHHRLHEVEDLRALCLESDRKLRKMFGIGVKEEEGEVVGIGGINESPKVELIEAFESDPIWDDMQDGFDSSESEELPENEQPRRSSGRVKTEMKPSTDEHVKNNATKAEQFPDSDEDSNNGNDSDFDPGAFKLKYKRRSKKRAKSEVKREPKTSKEGKPKSFQCTQCGEIYKSSRNLQEHETTHFPDKKNYKCHICSKEFARRNYYLKHLRLHKTSNQFKCNECDKAYHEDKLLQEHIRITHRGERPFHCKICGKTFPRSSSLYTHVAYFHEKRQAHQCDVCLRKCNSLYALERHKDRHRGIKPSQCPHCGNKYDSNNYLLQHIAERHPETMENLSRCQYCGLGYNTDSHYRTHVAKKHPERLEELERWLKAKREAVVQPPPLELKQPNCEGLS